MTCPVSYTHLDVYKRQREVLTTYVVAYQVVGQTSLKTKCSGVYIELPVQIIKDLIPDVILGHKFLDMCVVIINYTAHKIFLGKDEQLKLQWCDSSIKKNYN